MGMGQNMSKPIIYHYMDGGITIQEPSILEYLKYQGFDP